MAKNDPLSLLIGDLHRLQLSDAAVVERAARLGFTLAEKTIWNVRNGRHSPTYRTVLALQAVVTAVKAERAGAATGAKKDAAA